MQKLDKDEAARLDSLIDKLGDPECEIAIVVLSPKGELGAFVSSRAMAMVATDAMQRECAPLVANAREALLSAMNAPACPCPECRAERAAQVGKN